MGPIEKSKPCAVFIDGRPCHFGEGLYTRIELPSETFIRLRKENQELMIELTKARARVLLAERKGLPQIENVIFNAPATIVFWADGTKTIVKCQSGDTFNPELGLAMAIAKKSYGNKGNYNDVFKKWVPRHE